MERSRTSGRTRLKFGGRIAYRLAQVNLGPKFLAVLAIGAMIATGVPIANATLGSSFFIYAYNDQEPEINARAGLNGLADNSGGENPGGENPDSVIFSFACGTERLGITQSMLDWSDENRARNTNGESPNPYPDGGWNYIISLEEMDEYASAYALYESYGYSADVYAFSSDPNPELSLVPTGFDPSGLDNDSGPAFISAVKDSSGSPIICSYGNAHDGVADGSTPSSPAFYNSTLGQISYYLADMGTLVADDDRAAVSLRNGSETYWIQDGISWEEMIVHPRVYWIMRDRGDEPGGLAIRTDMDDTVEYFLREHGIGTDVSMDWYYYDSHGELKSFQTPFYTYSTDGSGGYSEDWTPKKPVNRIDGPSQIHYATDGSIEFTEYQWIGQSPEEAYAAPYGPLSQSYYENTIGGSGWMGLYSAGARNTEADR